MNKLLAALCALLALDPKTTTEDHAVVACNALKPKLDTLTGLRTALGVAPDADGASLIATCTALKTKATDRDALVAALGIDAALTGAPAVAACTAIKTRADGTAPDPSQYVPLSAFEAVKTQLAALTAKSVDTEVADLVESGLADGRLIAAQKEWATSLGKSDIAQLKAYLDSAQPIAALRGTQTHGAPIADADNPHKLTHGEIATCTAMGVSQEAFAKAKATAATTAAA